ASWRRNAVAVALAEERVLALQVFLIVAGAPLLCLAALVEERRQAAAALLQRLRFEQLIAQVSAAFVHAPSRRLHEALADALAPLGSVLARHAGVAPPARRPAGPPRVRPPPPPRRAAPAPRAGPRRALRRPGPRAAAHEGAPPEQ